MATLAVRPLNIKDLRRLGSVRNRQDIVSPDLVPALPMVMQRQILSAVPLDIVGDRAYAALVDGELCATGLLRPEPAQFRWNVIVLSAGSPRLVPDDDVYEELWSALLEYAVRVAGESGAKRLFAATRDDGPAYRSLRATGFEPYSRRTVMMGTPASDDRQRLPGFRPQEPSDVWSIHQLYHHVTPRAVQAAEALTSAAWETPIAPLWRRMVSSRRGAGSFVIETRDGIEAFLRVEARGHDAIVEWMATPGCSDSIGDCVRLGVDAVMGAAVRRVVLSVPDYAGEVVSIFERDGYEPVAEVVQHVRHTTAPALVHPKLVPLPAVEAVERVPRGVPTYYRRGACTVAASRAVDREIR